MLEIVRLWMIFDKVLGEFPSWNTITIVNPTKPQMLKKNKIFWKNFVVFGFRTCPLNLGWIPFEFFVED